MLCDATQQLTFNYEPKSKLGCKRAQQRKYSGQHSIYAVVPEAAESGVADLERECWKTVVYS